MRHSPSVSPSAQAGPRRLVIATRESRLALWQAEHVQQRLQQLYPDCEVTLLGMTTRGDRILDRTLSKVGGKGLFVKELEAALLDGRADLAVHSLKDVPVDMPDGFALPVVLNREDPTDAWVSARAASPAELPAGAVVGTSSLRREAQLRALYPHIEVRPLRGNLDTRLGKLDRGEYDGIVLATAGLQRLGLDERIRQRLAPELSLPAVGQGALGIEIEARRDDLAAWLAPLADAETEACVRAERAVSRALGGSCSVPLAAHAVLDAASQTLHLRALVAQPDGARVLRAEVQGPADAPEALGAAAAQHLFDQGAGPLLAALGVVAPSRA